VSTITLEHKINRAELIGLGVVVFATLTVAISLIAGFPIAVLSLLASLGVLITCIGLEA